MRIGKQVTCSFSCMQASETISAVEALDPVLELKYKENFYTSVSGIFYDE